jgi:hypothetical protein
MPERENFLVAGHVLYQLALRYGLQGADRQLDLNYSELPHARNDANPIVT